MENKGINKVEVKEENKQYKSQFELSKEEIKVLDRTSVVLAKSINKKTNMARYTAQCMFMGFAELTEKNFNAEKFMIVCLENGYNVSQLKTLTSVKLSVPFRAVSGIRRDNNERFYGIDLFISNSYRPRLFFSEYILRALKIANINLNYIEVESDGSELESLFEG